MQSIMLFLYLILDHMQEFKEKRCHDTLKISLDGFEIEILRFIKIRVLQVHLMESKDEAFEYVQDLVLRLKNELPNAMRAIRSDNGTEFKNTRFDAFCSDQGLDHQYSSPYVPQQNGVVERKNRTLVEMARTMLDEHRTPRRY